jgi:hypothetical protein
LPTHPQFAIVGNSSLDNLEINFIYFNVLSLQGLSKDLARDAPKFRSHRTSKPRVNVLRV